MSEPIRINRKRPLSLFEGFGVEMEYMITDSDTLKILPVSDKILQHRSGRIVSETSAENMAWSNELVLHVIEIKTDGAAIDLSSLPVGFQEQVSEINSILDIYGARLMPGAMHPWMDPYSEAKIWPHEYNAIYEAYNRIFDCRGHGWANLQSTHLNLPFNGDDEFGKLHAAIRLVLPLIPAMAASSPFADGERKSFLDFRMETYRTNSQRIPSITGKIVPEQVFTKEEYDRQIFQRMYRDIAPFDTEGILQEEWLNSRGAMSRWDRQTIEIRVIDIQENPIADIAIIEWIVNLIKALIEERWISFEDQITYKETDLYNILMETIKYGEQAVITNKKYLSIFGLNETSITASELCETIYSHLSPDYSFSNGSKKHLDLIFKKGPLGRRILNALPENFNREELFIVYANLCDCLKYGKPFDV